MTTRETIPGIWQESAVIVIHAVVIVETAVVVGAVVSVTDEVIRDVLYAVRGIIDNITDSISGIIQQGVPVVGVVGIVVRTLASGRCFLR